MAEIVIQERYVFDTNAKEAAKEVEKLAIEVGELDQRLGKATQGTKEFANAEAQLAAKERELQAVLAQEVKTIDGLNAKRSLLTKGLNQMTLGSREFIATQGEIEKINKSLKTGVVETTSKFANFKAVLTGSLAAVGIEKVLQTTIELGKASLEATRAKQSEEGALLSALRGQADVQQRLLAQAEEIEKTTLIDAGDIIAQEAYLASLGFTEEQIKKNISASADLSVVTGSVESASKLMIAAQNGQTKGLAKIIPEVRTLTKEQLANGAATDLVIQKFNGAAVAARQAGSDMDAFRQDARVAKEEFLEGFGGGLTDAFKSLLGGAKEVFKNIFGESSNFLTSISEVISGFVGYLAVPFRATLGVINGLIVASKVALDVLKTDFQLFKLDLEDVGNAVKKVLNRGLPTGAADTAARRDALNAQRNGQNVFEALKKGFNEAYNAGAGLTGDLFKTDAKQTGYVPDLLYGKGKKAKDTKEEVDLIVGSLAFYQKQLADLQKEQTNTPESAGDTVFAKIRKDIEATEDAISRLKALIDGVKRGQLSEVPQIAGRGVADQLQSQAAGRDLPIEFTTEGAAEAQRAKTAQAEADLEARKERLREIGRQVEALALQITNSIGAIFDALADRADRAVEKQRSALEKVLADADNYNADQINLERDRLAALEAEQKRAAERAKAFQIAQVAANAAIAISKAAAQGGVAAPFTIAATLLALVAGIAQAKIAAQSAFYGGTDFVPLGNNKRGRDTVPAWLHEGEGVLQADMNKRRGTAFKALRRDGQLGDVLEQVAVNWGQNSTLQPLRLREFGQTNTTANVTVRLSSLESRMDDQSYYLRKIARNTETKAPKSRRQSSFSNISGRFVG